MHHLLHHIEKRFLLFLLIFALLIPEAAALPAADPPELECRAAVLYDLETGALLYEKNADASIPPASMTKLMSLHLAYEAIASGQLSKEQLIPISPEASFQASPPRSSLMFLETGQRVTLLDLMIGLALPSGNDAGVALARAVAGSMPAFVERMNSEARRLGLTKTRFVDSFGYSAENLTTPREFARFCRFYLETHPEAIEELHRLTEYTYPREENIPQGGSSVYGPITQYNHNVLVGILDGVDGLKTGYIDESGYNLALTAEREGRRLLAVLMGGPGEDSRQGGLVRAVDATSLISYGFYASRTFVPEGPSLPPRRVYLGERKTVQSRTEALPAITLPAEEALLIEWEILYKERLSAPLAEGSRIGELICRSPDGSLLFSRPILSAERIKRGGLWRRIWDSAALFMAGLPWNRTRPSNYIP